MRFVKTLTVTAGSTKTSPSSTPIRLIKGVITLIEIAFPPGPANYVSVVIRESNLQIAPANPEAAFRWDDFTHSFSMDYTMIDIPYELKLIGWAPDATYDHEITFRFDVDTKGKDERELLLERMVEPFKPYG